MWIAQFSLRMLADIEQPDTQRAEQARQIKARIEARKRQTDQELALRSEP